MEIEYISLPKLKQEIRGADLTGDQVFLCCMPGSAVPVDQMYRMQESSDKDGRTPERRSGRGWESAWPRTPHTQARGSPPRHPHSAPTVRKASS